MQNYVFVLNGDGKPLSPCHPAVARKLLKKGKATMDKLHNCSTCVFAKYCPATSGAAYFGAAPEEASYYCHVFEVVTEEGELEHCAVWVDADA